MNGLQDASQALRSALSLIQTSKIRQLDEDGLARLNTEIEGLLEDFTDEDLRLLEYDWTFWARPKQLAPKGDWALWMILAGRGFGKTRTGAQWVHSRAMEWPGRWIALVAKTPADARDYMIEGPGGFEKNSPPWEKPKYEPSKRRLTWPNGSWATVYSDEEPDQLRGFSGDTAWLDEFAKYRNPQDCWDNLAFGMREASNDRPRRLITTTPRPLKILKTLIAMKTTVYVHGTSHENRDNLDPTWYRETILDYENTRLGRQEVAAEILTDLPGALWTYKLLEDTRVPGRDARDQSRAEWIKFWNNQLVSVVVALDPAAKGPDAKKRDAVSAVAESGIIVAGLGENGHGYVLEDRTVKDTPDVVANELVKAYDEWSANAVIGEINNGGDWIGTVVKMKAADLHRKGTRPTPHITYRTVTATRGKQTRASQVSPFYEQGNVHHVGIFPELEDQMTSWDPLSSLPSPDRMDANVWALTDLMVKSKNKAGVLF